MRKLLLLLSCAAALAVSAPAALAFDNLAVGDTIDGTAVTSIPFGSFVRCTNSSYSGPVTSNAGTDQGGAASLTSVTYTGCTGSFGTPATVTANNLPWAWSVDGTGAGAMSMDFTLTWGSTTCHYAGTITFAYDAADWGANGDAPMSGSTTRLSGNSSSCTGMMAMSGTYNIVGPNGVIDL